MNKQEKFFALLLGLALAGWVFYTGKQEKARMARQAAAPAPAAAAAAVSTNAPAAPAAAITAAPPAPAAAMPWPAAAAADTLPAPGAPERRVRLTAGDGALLLDCSSHGAVIRQATLAGFATSPGRISKDNPPVRLDFSAAPALELAGIAGLAQNAAYDVAEASSNSVTFTAKTAQGLELRRRIELGDDFLVRVRDTFRNAGAGPAALGTNSVSIGAMARGASKNDLLSADSLPAGEKAKIRFWDRERDTKGLMAAGAGGGFGCSKAKSAAGMADRATVPVVQPQSWIALKNRFFVSVFSSDAANSGFVMTLARDTAKPAYSLKELSARVFFEGAPLAPGETRTREYRLFIGPKKLSLLRAMGRGIDGVMQFGMFSWFCRLLVPTLNFFHLLIPNYGVAIILLTFLVRILFWPLTHKSTQSMKKMQEIQPKLKEIQKLYKDNPQKMQQETWAVYRDNKVNPLASCLPMLIQIPVFIALFTVLRSAVELRYAPFLWIADLSEPENLFAGVLPIPLNILPILMAGTMALQSYLTPSAGDPQQQRMMMVLMPAMMLFMFYSFPSALSLYWTVSQALSIVQMVMIQRRGKKDGAPAPAGPPLTRQQRRHGNG